MSVEREGGCACGALRYQLASEPLVVHCCRCLNCQRQTGSAFAINLLIEADRLQLVAGTAHQVDVPRDDGSMQAIFRCPRCEVALFSEYGPPEVRFVPGGTLDDPSDITPDVAHLHALEGWVGDLVARHARFDDHYDPKELWPPESLPGSKQFSLTCCDAPGDRSVRVARRRLRAVA